MADTLRVALDVSIGFFAVGSMLSRFPVPRSTVLLTIAVASAAFWIVAVFLVRRGVRAFRPLAVDPAWEPPGERWPRASIIVASRDEAEHVAAAMRTLLALDYPDYEVVAVDDRSADGTRERLEEIAHGDPRLRVVRVDELPPGWLGKCHALHRGVQAATGDWLLFTDADVRFAPATLRIAMRRALEGELDLLSLMPYNESRSPWMRAFYIAAFFGLIVAMGYWAHSPRRQSLVASSAGAFALVRRRAYERAGGHEALRLALIDDMELGGLIRKSGGRTEIAMGMDWIRVPWSTSVPELFRVVRKNGFAAFNYSWLLLGGFSLGTVLVSMVGPFCALVEPALWPWTVAVWISLADIYRHVGRLVDASPLLVILHPLTCAMAMAATWNSAFWIWKEGGVRWRGTLYPLASLKRWS